MILPQVPNMRRSQMVREGKIIRLAGTIKKIHSGIDGLSYQWLIQYTKNKFLISDRSAKDYITAALFKLKLTKEDLKK